jgi:hypothetical protein
MTYEDAKRILDKHKEGSHDYSMLTINRALYICGDIVSEQTRMACEVGKYERLERICLAQSEGTERDSVIQGNQRRFGKDNEVTE